MMLRLALLAALNGMALATLDKPAIQPAFDLDGSMETQLQEYLPKKAFAYDQWSPGWVPQNCYEAANDNGMNATDYDVYNVTYTDCSESWVICRHKNASLPADDIFILFGQVPVGMRAYLANIVVLPAEHPVAVHPITLTAAAYSTGGYTVFFGNTLNLGLMAHEFTHILDMVALTKYVSDPGSQPFSHTSYWQTPLLKDTALPSAYAGSAWHEDFAEAGRVALSDMVVPGGLAGINPNSSQIHWQVETYKKYMHDIIYPPGGSCTVKTPSSPPVPMTQGAETNFMALGPKPDVSLSGEVPEIVVPEEAKKLKFVYPPPANGTRSVS